MSKSGRDAQHADFIGEGPRPDHRFRDRLAAAATRPAAAAWTAAGLLIAGEGHPQDNGQNHQAQQDSSSDEEEVAFDHAEALW